MSQETFPGFPQAGLKFLADLGDNNNREWFERNRSIFEDKLQTPAQEFITALGRRLQSISANVVYDTRLNGTGSLMRIYRDTRFSKDKTPYKTNLTMALWEGPSKKAAHSGFYLRIEANGAGLMTGRHVFEKAAQAAYRQAVVDEHLGAELEAALESVQQAGDYVIAGEHYKKVPRDYDVDHPRADLLRYNGLHAFYFSIKPDHLTSPELVDICYRHFVNMAPLHHWLVKLGQKE